MQERNIDYESVIEGVAGINKYYYFKIDGKNYYLDETEKKKYIQYK
jgi:hypothetical protein